MANPTGILLPMPRVGIPLTSGLKAFFYAPGTSNKRDTYTTSALSVGNNNPVVADSNGLFPPIYLDPAYGYKLVLAPSTDTDPPTSPILTQDNLYLPAMYPVAQLFQARLTLTSATPVTTADVTAATTLYCSPMGGGIVTLYDTTKAAWQPFILTEINDTLAALTASKLYDIFMYNNAGTPSFEYTAWSTSGAGSSTRATALTTQNGVLVKSGDASRRYLGTVYINASGGQTDDAANKRYLWNYYNRVPRALRKLPTSNWNYTLAAWQQANASTANQVELVIGVAEVPVGLTLLSSAANTGAGQRMSVAIGEDSTSTPSASCLFQGAESPVANYYVGLSARLDVYPSVGYHKYTHLEYSTASGTTTWQGAGTQFQSGLSGSVLG